MPINPMMPVQESRPGRSKLETVATALDMATKVLGVGLETYNQPLKRQAMQAQVAESQADTELKKAQALSHGPMTAEKATLYSTAVPPSLKKTYTPDTLQHFSTAEVEQMIPAWNTRSSTESQATVNQQFVIQNTTDPYEGGQVPKGYKVRDFSHIGLGPRLVEDKVAERMDKKQDAKEEDTKKEYEDAKKVVRQYVQNLTIGGRGAANARQVGQQIMNVQKAESILDAIDRGEVIGDKRIAMELGTDLIRTISGGTTAGDSGERQAMIPNTLFTGVQGLAEQVSGNPKSILNPEFRAQYRHQFDLLRKNLNQFSQDFGGSGASLFQDEFKRWPQLEKMYWQSLISGSHGSIQDPNATGGGINSKIQSAPSKTLNFEGIKF